MPARLLHEAEHHAEAEAGALADILGRVEGLEGAGKRLRRHAHAGIGNRDHHILPRLHLVMMQGVAFVEMCIAGFECQLAALRHGIAGIDDEVEHRHLELPGIDLGEPEARPAHEFEFDLLGNRPPQHRLDAGDQLVHVDNLRLQCLSARECEQPVRQFRAALCRLCSHLRHQPELLILGQARCKQFGIAQNNGEQIVEIMRHAAGKLAHGFKLLRLAQALFQPAALGDVAFDRDPMRIFALVTGDRHDLQLDPELLARLRIVEDFRARRLPFLDGLPDPAAGCLVGLRSLQESGRLADHFLARITRPPHESIVDINDAGARRLGHGRCIGDDHHVVQPLQRHFEQSESRFTLAFPRDVAEIDGGALRPRMEVHLEPGIERFIIELEAHIIRGLRAWREGAEKIRHRLRECIPDVTSNQLVARTAQELFRHSVEIQKLVIGREHVKGVAHMLKRRCELLLHFLAALARLDEFGYVLKGAARANDAVVFVPLRFCNGAHPHEPSGSRYDLRDFVIAFARFDAAIVESADALAILGRIEVQGLAKCRPFVEGHVMDRGRSGCPEQAVLAVHDTPAAKANPLARQAHQVLRPVETGLRLEHVRHILGKADNGIASVFVVSFADSPEKAIGAIGPSDPVLQEKLMRLVRSCLEPAKGFEELFPVVGMHEQNILVEIGCSLFARPAGDLEYTVRPVNLSGLETEFPHAEIEKPLARAESCFLFVRASQCLTQFPGLQQQVALQWRLPEFAVHLRIDIKRSHIFGAMNDIGEAAVRVGDGRIYSRPVAVLICAVGPQYGIDLYRHDVFDMECFDAPKRIQKFLDTGNIRIVRIAGHDVDHAAAQHFLALDHGRCGIVVAHGNDFIAMRFDDEEVARHFFDQSAEMFDADAARAAKGCIVRLKCFSLFLGAIEFGYVLC